MKGGYLLILAVIGFVAYVVDFLRKKQHEGVGKYDMQLGNFMRDASIPETEHVRIVIVCLQRDQRDIRSYLEGRGFNITSEEDMGHARHSFEVETQKSKVRLIVYTREILALGLNAEQSVKSDT